jgi:hypothetical protein
MKAFIVWTALGAVSVMLGMALYSTSLQGSTTGYRESDFTPRPAPTVVKTKTKIVRKPAKTKVVYVPAPTPESQAATSSTTQSGTSSTQSWTPSSDQGSSKSDSGDHKKHDD